jgi:hypothetical protein
LGKKLPWWRTTTGEVVAFLERKEPQREVLILVSKELGFLEYVYMIIGNFLGRSEV